MNAHLIIAALAVAAPLAHAACAPKEYAQLKDEAATKVGQMGLAFEMCQAKIGIDNANKMADLAIQYQRTRDADRAMRDMQSCMDLRSKIGTALSAAKATTALEYANGGCQGSYPTK